MHPPTTTTTTTSWDLRPRQYLSGDYWRISLTTTRWVFSSFHQLVLSSFAEDESCDNRGSGEDSSEVARRTRGRGFDSRQERREKFLLEDRLSVLTLISVSVPPRVTTVTKNKKTKKDPGLSAKNAGGRFKSLAPYVCDSTRHCKLVVWCTQNVHRDGSTFASVAPAM